jgi:hypothetical protein
MLVIIIIIIVAGRATKPPETTQWPDDVKALLREPSFET